MRFLKTAVKVCSLVICMAAIGWTMLVLITAKVLGEVVLIGEADVYVALALNALAIPALVVVLVAMWRGRHRRKALQALVPVGYPMYAQPTYGAPVGYAPPPSPAWTPPVNVSNHPAA